MEAAEQSGFKRNPERINVTPIPGTIPQQFNPGTYVGGFNPPYTAPDLNNVYLAEVMMDPIPPASDPNKLGWRLRASTTTRSWTSSRWKGCRSSPTPSTS